MADKEKKVMGAAMNILRRLPAKDALKNIAAVKELVQGGDQAQTEQWQDDVNVKADQPLNKRTDGDTGQEFLPSEYYNDGDSYRSPYSNKYYPKIDVAPGEEEPIYPSQEHRELEVCLNETFQRYCKSYYDDSFISSCYVFDTSDNTGGFGSAWLVKKSKQQQNGIDDGAWDGIHIITATQPKQNAWDYRVNSTIYLSLAIENQENGKIIIAGNSSKVKEIKGIVLNPKLDKDTQLFHIGNMGKLVEENEMDMKNEMVSIYISKSKQIIHTGRLADEYRNAEEKGELQAELIATLKAQNQNKQ